MINEITDKLFSGSPAPTLYHYTTFSGLMGIVENRAIWASEVRYMNDSAELRHTAQLVKEEVGTRITQGHKNPALLNEFQNWIINRISSDQLLFATSFRSNGNMLSQWRGYSSIGQGVSIGFNSEFLLKCCDHKNFKIGHCIYDPTEQKTLIAELLDGIEELANADQIQQNAQQKEIDATQHYRKVFEEVESHILEIAAILKHPSFEEEDEWRIVSPIITRIEEADIQFREGANMIVPYIQFDLTSHNKYMELDHVFLGPTPNIHSSMNSLNLYFRKMNAIPKRGVDYCQIPYRQR